MKVFFKLFCLILFFCGGCNTFTETRDIKAQIIENAQESLSDMPGVTYHYPGLTDKDARKSLEEWLSVRGGAIFPDVHYIRIKHESFIAFNKWFQETTEQLKNEEIGDGYDCDNYSFLYKSLLGVSSYKNKNLREILIGVIYVKQKHPFGGIPSGKFDHALNIIYTELGWFIYEPQTGKFDKIENYPNEILWFIF